MTLSASISRVAAFVVLSLPAPAVAALIDLGHPTLAAFVATGLGSGARGVVFDPLQSLSITSAGIVIDPLIEEATRIGLEIWDITGGDATSVGGRNLLRASNEADIIDTGQTFYDIPVNFTFVAGTRYELAFVSVMPSDWLANRWAMELYGFHFPTQSSYDLRHRWTGHGPRRRTRRRFRSHSHAACAHERGRDHTRAVERAPARPRRSGTRGDAKA